jgi:hypothetical protein
VLVAWWLSTLTCVPHKLVAQQIRGNGTQVRGKFVAMTNKFVEQLHLFVAQLHEPHRYVQRRRLHLQGFRV